MTTTNLEFPYIAASQAQKEVTHNEALDLIDAAISALASIALSDADTLLTDEQVVESASIVFTGTLTAARKVTFPAKQKLLLVKNSTTGGYALNLIITGGSVTITVSSGAQKLIYLDGTDINEITVSGNPYDIGGSIVGAPTDGAVLLRYPVPRAVRFLSGMSLSKGVAGTAATATAAFSIKKNGTEFATMTFAGSATTATFACATTTNFSAGDVLTLVAPATADATLADIGFALSGLRI